MKRQTDLTIEYDLKTPSRIYLGIAGTRATLCLVCDRDVTDDELECDHTSGTATQEQIQSRKRVLDAIQRDDLIGFCFACGAENKLVKPDARNRICDKCAADEVFAAQELLLMEVGL